MLKYHTMTYDLFVIYDNDNNYYSFNRRNVNDFDAKYCHRQKLIHLIVF